MTGNTYSKLPGSGLAKFFALRGRPIMDGCSSLWYSAPHRFLISLPYQQPLNPAPEAIQALLRSSKASGVRFMSRQWGGISGGVYVCCDRKYSLDTIHKKNRTAVRRALETYEIRHVKEGELLGQGLQLNRETMARQGRYDPEFGEEGQWSRFVKAIPECPEIEAFGAFVGKRLCAYLITCREDRWLNILHQMSRPDDLKSYPNHVLTYSVTKAACEDPSLKGVSYGLVPLIVNNGLHEYKIRLGYSVIPQSCVVVLRPELNLFLNNRFVRWGVNLFCRLRPNDRRLEMTGTILRAAEATSSERF